jgi:hypothetical protein
MKFSYLEVHGKELLWVAGYGTFQTLLYTALETQPFP